MAMIGSDALQNSPLRREALEVPELGGEVLLRELTGAELNKVRNAAQKETGGIGLQASYLTLRFGWINEDGSHVMTDKDLPSLDNWAFRVIDAIGVKVMELSGYVNEAKAEAKND